MLAAGTVCRGADPRAMMSPVATFEFILMLLVATLGLEVLARVTRLPPAAALTIGGIALAFMPGLPAFSLDPDFILLVFLPPLLIHGAYSTAWTAFLRDLPGILALAIGAVAFTTLVVGLVTHWLVPSLPWAACFALGAVVSPPDAVAAKALLTRVRLPMRLAVLLEGESLLNDAAGLVLYRFAVAATLSGTFSATEAGLAFGGLAFGGIAVGVGVGLVWVQLLRLLKDVHLTIAATFVLPWAAYVGGEAAHVSGVIATVVAGLILGWHQHTVFTAGVRLRTTATWHMMIYLMEAFVFVLIGLSFRGVAERLGSANEAILFLVGPVAGIVAAVVLSRFAWVFGVYGFKHIASRLLRTTWAPLSPAAATTLAWSGMRGVVTLAIAIALPDALPGRDLILTSAFAVILVTILLQGTTLGPLIRLLGLQVDFDSDAANLSRAQAHSHIVRVQLKAAQELMHADNRKIFYPECLKDSSKQFSSACIFSIVASECASNHRIDYSVLLAMIAAGRAETIRLYRSGLICEEILQKLEYELDLQELSAEAAQK